MSDHIAEVRANVDALKRAFDLRERSLEWVVEAARFKYTYNFMWMGRPIIQLPQDLLAMQEIICDVRPSFVVETGIAHGGSTVFYASILQLLGGDGHVVAIDVDIRPDNREALESHPLRHRFTLVEGSSTDPRVVEQVFQLTDGQGPIVVCLDSDHSHAHVLEELRRYSPLVGRGSYVIVFDTIVELFASGSFPDRRWDKGDSPMTAVDAFLAENARFAIDEDWEARNLLTACPRGYLRCVAD